MTVTSSIRFARILQISTLEKSLFLPVTTTSGENPVKSPKGYALMKIRKWKTKLKS